MNFNDFWRAWVLGIRSSGQSATVHHLSGKDSPEALNSLVKRMRREDGQPVTVVFTRDSSRWSADPANINRYIDE